MAEMKGGCEAARGRARLVTETPLGSVTKPSFDEREPGKIAKNGARGAMRASTKIQTRLDVTAHSIQVSAAPQSRGESLTMRGAGGSARQGAQLVRATDVFGMLIARRV